MANAKRRRLESTVAAIQQRYGVRALRVARDLPKVSLPATIATGFADLDAMTGCRGVPLGAITLLTGPSTSGKLTVAYKTLAAAQQNGRHPVALIDLTHSTDPDYLARCGVDLEHLLLVRPGPETPIDTLVLDLVRSRHLRLLFVDSLADLPPHMVARWAQGLDGLALVLREENCALLCVDEPAPPWRRWLNLDPGVPLRRRAALHLEMQRERWLIQDGDLVGYQAQARLRYSRWRPGHATAPVSIHFNGTVKAAVSW
ncbi:MAG: hypothetical protein KBG20_03865 [Caldilineaceae bacterium]|nr:hypothetical protein [Caldilineaceae bacterium]MBP8106538.1 hypothetical protein [Caldilineaceae bacterium]MBP8121560.1 hypothetical protein [Caldilineaceae bacterium]MBP9071405.1 hypothetical protein [Caldilineaceae bacterium]